jgi:hypothetical protein
VLSVASYVASYVAPSDHAVPRRGTTLPKKCGRIEIADRLIDSMPSVSTFWPVIRTPDADEMRSCALACVAFPWASTSSSTDSKGEDVLILHVLRGSRNIEALCGCNGRKVPHPIERRSAMDLLKRFFV